MKTLPVIKSKYQLLHIQSEDLTSYRYLAKLKSGKRVLIWQYKPEYIPSQAAEKIIKLCEKLMTLKHPNILQMTDYHYDGKHLYTIYEIHQNYESLETVLKTADKANLKHLWKITKQIIAGLTAIEDKNLYYGSLNLTNIFIGEDGVIKLTKPVLPILFIGAQINKLKVIEDCMYYSPEFLQTGKWSIRADIYSFAVLLTVFFSGNWPYPYTNKLATLRRELLKPPIPFKGIAENLPPKLESLIQTCLQKDIENRLSSFHKVIQEYRLGSGLNQDPQPNKTAKIEQHIAEKIKEENTQLIKRTIKIAIASILLVIALSSMYWVYINYLTAIPDKKVPNIVGNPLQEGLTALKRTKLNYKVVGSRFHPTIPENHIIETKPPHSRDVKANRVIRLYLSKGPMQYLLPNLKGRTIEQAKTILHSHQDKLMVAQSQFSEDIEKGRIISQIPTPDATLGPSQNIFVTLSKGFPIVMNVSKLKKGPKNKRLVILSFYVQKDWDTQKVSVFQVIKGTSQKLYTDRHSRGEYVELEFELDKKGTIDVYFNDELAYSNPIQDPTLKQAPERP